MAKRAWFESWFDSPYYHLLYKDRNEKQAELEIDALLKGIVLRSDARVLDLACGKGRHAVHLSGYGYDVTGLDISEESIRFARTLEHEKLHFFSHDMRRPFRSNYFDAVFNLFTSFGYFNQMRENAIAMRHIATNLKPGGILVLDFFNSNYIRKNLVRNEVKTVEEVEFRIHRSVRNGFVYKTIRFHADSRSYQHREKVQLLQPKHFTELCEQAGLKLEAQFGDYDLRPFHLETSRRFIFTARKP